MNKHNASHGLIPGSFVGTWLLLPVQADESADQTTNDGTCRIKSSRWPLKTICWLPTP